MRSLLSRLMLVVAAALAPALIFLAYTANQAREIRQQLVIDEALRILNLVTAEQKRIIEGAGQSLAALAAALAVNHNDPVFCQHLLGKLLEGAPRYGNAGVIGLDGRLICSANPEGVGVDLSDRAYFKDAIRTGHLVIGEYMIGRVVGRPSFVIAEPIKNEDGTLSGVLELSLGLQWLGQQLDAIALPQGVVARIADHNGIVLARRPDGGRYVGKPLLPENRFLIEGDRVGVRTARSLDGRMLTIAYAPPGYDQTSLAVGIGLDPNTTFAGIAQADRAGLILVMAGGILALLLTALLGNRIIRRPAVQLLTAAAEWRTGALATRTNLADDNSEFGRIGAALDDMAEALEQREAAVRTALESTTDAVIVVDHDWQFIYINKHARVLTGDRDLIGHSFWATFPYLEQATFAKTCQDALESGLSAKVATVCDETLRHFETSVFPSDDGLTLYIRDVTEEHRIADALQESELRLELARDAAGVGIWNTDMVTGESVWSDQKWRLYGLEPRAGSVNREFRKARIHPDDRDRVDAEIARSLAQSGWPYVTEHRVIWPDGSVHWLVTRGAVTRDQNGTAVGLLGITLDVTESRKTELALRGSETRLQLARKIAGFGTWEGDLSRGSMVWSDELWRLNGLEPGPGAPDMTTWLSIVHPDDRDGLKSEWKRSVSDTTREFNFTYRAVWPNGTIRWLQTRASLLPDRDGKVVHVVGLAFDVTDLRASEDALRRLSNELEQRVREEVAAREAAQDRAAQAERVQALGQLAGGIAHDFNNVLQAVSGAMAMIDRRLPDDSGIRRLVKLAADAAERGASITRRLLTFGRRGDLMVEALDVAELLQGLREVLAPTLGSPIALSIKLGTDLPRMRADKRQLETVLVNLATNARDAMPIGGRLVFSADAEWVEASGHPHPAGIEPGAYVRLGVSDTGIGMSAETLARAREPFFTTKKLGAGTGLGLAMVQSFAEQSGGGLCLESHPGEGTTVTLWLPRALVEDTGPAVTAVTPRPSVCPALTRVLVVDDEFTVREVLADYLESAGYVVMRAANGAEALALLETGRPVDALITDLAMPGIDGFAVIRAARNRWPDMPAILLTGYAGDDAALALGRSIGGAVSLLRKPVSDLDLLDRLSSMLAAAARDARPSRSAARVT